MEALFAILLLYALGLFVFWFIIYSAVLAALRRNARD